VVFRSHGQPLISGIEARAFGHSPAQEYAVEFESEIVMQPRGVVLLDKVGEFFAAHLNRSGRRFGRLFEIAFAAVFF
jgi:hypothetical protein